MTIDEYFLKFTERLAYLDLKEDVGKKLEITSPMPIRMEDFSKAIKEQDFKEKIDAHYFAKGMIWNLAIDPHFIYANEYKKILQKIVKKPSDMAIRLGMEYIKNGENESALIAFRAANILNPSSKFAKSQYANLLWRTPNLDKETSEAFVKESSKLLEEALRIDDKDPFVNLSLAELNASLAHYNKALSYYQIALSEVENEEFIENVREGMRSIKDEADLENAIYEINRVDYDEALEILYRLESQTNRWDVYYYIGLCKQNMAEYGVAVEAFRKALDKGGNLEDIHNGLVYNLTALGRYEEALEACNLGINIFPAALRLRFNRAVILFQLDKKEEALEDLDFLLAYQDLSDEFFNQIMILREEVNRQS